MESTKVQPFLGYLSDGYPCNQCDFTGRTVSALRCHVTKRHMEAPLKPLKCDFGDCDYRTTEKNNLSSHIRRCHAEDSDKYKVHACNQCDYKAYKKSQLRQHAARHNDERPFECDFPSCTFRTKRQWCLDQHKKCHDPDQDKLQIYACAFCGYRFRFKGNLIKHLSTHTEDKPHTCEHPGCNYRTREIAYLQRHRKTHDPDLMFKCNFPGCEYRAVEKWNLDCHQETHNPERKNDLQCPLCHKAFAAKKTLSRHIIDAHTKERPISCKYCDSTFTHMSKLRLHIVKAHATQAQAVDAGLDAILRKYECNVCGYSSVRKTHVVLHQQNRHSSIRSFACENCDYIGKTKTSLQSHLQRSHVLPRVKLFQCELCKKKFFTRDKREDHLRAVHRQEKLHNCPHCDYATYYASAFRAHQKKQSPEDLTKCQIIARRATLAAGGRLIQTRNCASSAKTGESYYKCDFYGCSFVTVHQTGLSHHKRRHYPENQNVSCPMCSKKFFTTSELKAHIKFYHAKEKHFSCDVCDYSTNTSTRLRVHKQRHACKTVHKNTARMRDSAPESIMPVEKLEIKRIYSCPFCDWGHIEYATILRHTVIHRLPVVSLGKTHLT